MNIEAAELDKNSPHYIHNLFMRNAMLWDSPTEQWAMSEEDFIKVLEQFKAEQKQSIVTDLPAPPYDDSVTHNLELVTKK